MCKLKKFLGNLFIFFLILSSVLPIAPSAKAAFTPVSTHLGVSPSVSMTSSGTLTTDEVWSGTVNITGDVIVPSGITLTIQPGTTVRFAALSHDRHGGSDTSRCELIINGSLNAVGTPQSPITFTSSSASPMPNHWAGIRANVAGAWQTPVFTLQYAIVEYSTSGIVHSMSGTASPPYIGNCTIRYNGSYYGIYLSASGGSGSARVEGCTIYNNGGYGIYASGYNGSRSLSILNNTINNNTQYGIYCDSSTVTLDHNTIHHNNYYGLLCSSTTATITNNEVYSNNNSGIYCTQGSSVINNNSIHDNTQYGIYIYASGSFTISISLNNIYNNSGGGIYCNASSVARLNYNNIYGGTYALYNDSSSAVDARYNWWGAVTTSEMASGSNPKNISAIYDIYDNTAKGTVDYSQWLSAALALTSEPTSYITDPVSGSHVKALSYTIRGVASAGAGVSRVEVSTDGGSTWYTASGTTSWTYNWAIPSEGTYSIKSRAVDNSGITEAPKDGPTLYIVSLIITTSGTLTTDEVWSGTVNITGLVLPQYP